METRGVAECARTLRLVIEENGTDAFERNDWAERFRELGFEMDCGHSYKERYELALYDVWDSDVNLRAAPTCRCLTTRSSRSAGILRIGRLGLAA